MRHTSSPSDIRAMNAHVIDEFRANNGRVGGEFGSVPPLLLHVTGARSHRTYVVPLVYRRDGDRPAVVASNGGTATYSAWYRNLVVHTDVRGGRRRPSQT